MVELLLRIGGEVDLVKFDAIDELSLNCILHGRRVDADGTVRCRAGGNLPGSIVKISPHHQPITAILYASSMTTVVSAIQADRV
jgi:hypothetical protein